MAAASEQDQGDSTLPLDDFGALAISQLEKQLGEFYTMNRNLVATRNKLLILAPHERETLRREMSEQSQSLRAGCADLKASMAQIADKTQILLSEIDKINTYAGYGTLELMTKLAEQTKANELLTSRLQHLEPKRAPAPGITQSSSSWGSQSHSNGQSSRGSQPSWSSSSSQAAFGSGFKK